jgi:hypothetical protein
MYNLSVETAHTFYVGEGQWLVHNANGPKTPYTVNPTEAGLNTIRQHLSGDLSAPFNDDMISRIETAIKGGQKLTGADANFYLHEIKEATLMGKGLTYEQAHAKALKNYGLSEFDLYHPDVIQKNKGWFNDKWPKYWGIGC